MCPLSNELAKLNNFNVNNIQNSKGIEQKNHLTDASFCKKGYLIKRALLRRFLRQIYLNSRFLAAILLLKL